MRSVHYRTDDNKIHLMKTDRFDLTRSIASKTPISDEIPELNSSKNQSGATKELEMSYAY